MRGPAKIAFFLLLAVSCIPPLFSSTAFGHGDNPSICENRYDAEITSMAIDNGTQTFDPISDSDLEISAQIGKGYDVTFTLHTANVSSQNNTLSGSAWYRSLAFGFGSGVCINEAGPDKDIPLVVHVDVMAGVPDGYTQNGVEWGSWPDTSQVRYNVIWYNATGPEPAEEPQDNQTNSEQPSLPAATDEEPEHSDESEDDEEFEDDDSAGSKFSPFVFKDRESAVAATVVEDLTEGQRPLMDVLHINGTLASYHFLISVKPYILSGNWSMTMNDTAVLDFDANFTMVRSDGLERREYSLTNLTAVNSSGMTLANGTMSMKSQLDFANGTATRLNATITLYRLNTVAIQLEGMSTPIYGMVDKVVRIQDGQISVIVRQFDMI